MNIEEDASRVFIIRMGVDESCETVGEFFTNFFAKNAVIKQENSLLRFSRVGNIVPL